MSTDLTVRRPAISISYRRHRAPRPASRVRTPVANCRVQQRFSTPPPTAATCHPSKHRLCPTSQHRRRGAATSTVRGQRMNGAGPGGFTAAWTGPQRLCAQGTALMACPRREKLRQPGYLGMGWVGPLRIRPSRGATCGRSSSGGSERGGNTCGEPGCSATDYVSHEDRSHHLIEILRDDSDTTAGSRGARPVSRSETGDAAGIRGVSRRHHSKDVARIPGHVAGFQ